MSNTNHLEINYTSFSLSKKLAEAGCDIKSIYSWCCRDGVSQIFGEKELISFLDGFSSAKKKYYKSYDILNDICCLHQMDFFGQNHYRNNGCDIPESIFTYMRQGKKGEAEKLILKWCVFNKDS